MRFFGGVLHVSGFRYMARLYALYAEDRIAERSAALAYHAMLALVPLVAFVLFAGGLFLGERVFVDTALQYIQNTLGRDVAALFEELFVRIIDFRANYFISIAGIVVVLYGTTNFFTQLRSAFSEIFDFRLEEEEEGLLRATVMGRLAAFVYMVLLLALFFLTFLAHMVIVVLFEISNEYFLGGLVTAQMAQALGVVLSFALALALFSLVYRFVGAKRVTRHGAFFGGLVAAILFTLLNALFSLILTQSTALAAYGVAGSLVAFILWIHYIIQALLIGAEVTKLSYLRRRNSSKRLNPHGTSVR